MASRPLDIVFVVQGEGRGHLTQASALAAYLRAAGHRVVATYVGTSPVRAIPEYFIDEIGSPVHTFDAPVLVPDRHRRAVSTARTSRQFLRFPAYVWSGLKLKYRVQRHPPDVVVNFFDLVSGIALALPPSSGRRVAVAHNYFLGHPAAAPPEGRWGRAGVRFLSWLTALGAERRLALSFDAHPTQRTIQPVPPLLRPGLGDLSRHDGGYLMAYLLNAGYVHELAAWHRESPEEIVHCYVGGGGAAVGLPSQPGFHLHDLEGTAFLRHLAGCRAFVTTGGFESVCEAFYLGKPVLTIPVEGTYEQAFNALDAHRVGAARSGSYADLDRFWKEAVRPDAEDVARFRAWVETAPEILVRAIEGAPRVR